MKILKNKNEVENKMTLFSGYEKLKYSKRKYIEQKNLRKFPLIQIDNKTQIHDLLLDRNFMSVPYFLYGFLVKVLTLFIFLYKLINRILKNKLKGGKYGL